MLRETELSMPFNKNQLNFYGYFSTAEISVGTTGQGDEYRLDLSHLDNSSGTYMLSLGVVSAALGLGTDYEIYVKRDDAASSTLYTSSFVLPSAVLNPDVRTVVPLSSTSSDNIFTVKILPKVMSSENKSGLFGVTRSLSKAEGLYLLQAEVTTYNSSSSTYEGIDSELGTAYPEDNAFCAEGEALVTASAYTTASSDTGVANSGNDIGVSCATISSGNDNGNEPNGMGSFVLGFLLVLLVMFPAQIRDKFLS